MFSGKLKAFISFLFATVIIQATCFCQTNFIPSLIPPSPNAATLMKFSDVPVSTYTGTADVNIPIYNIQARGISVPVSLDYHTGGVRVKEESGWVGLGWSLSSGGMISRTIMGLDDFGGEYFNSGVPDVTGNLLTQPVILLQYPGGQSSSGNALGVFGYDFFCDDSVYTDQGTKNFGNPLANSVPGDDFEPDIFSYNFLGRSGKFIINRSGKVIIQKQDNLIVQYGTNGSTFTIVDDQGNKFYFLDKEYTKPSSGGAQAISSWFLSRIVTQLNDTVSFKYTSDSTWTSLAGDPYEILRFGCATLGTPTFGTSVPNSYLNITLQDIDYSNGELQFSFDNNRTDLSSGKKLNKIQVYSKNAAGTLTYVKEQQLFYSYFFPGQTPALELQRLRLDSVKEVSGNVSSPPYSFVYNIPNVSGSIAKHSYSVDHWGYYSGFNNNMSQFTPEFNGIFSVPGTIGLITTFYYLPGANREPDSVSMQAFSLQKVTYPTGGYTVFQYEPNYYDDLASKTGPIDLPQLHLVDTLVQFALTGRGNFSGSVDLSNIFQTGLLDPNIYFTVAFRSERNADSAIYHNRTGLINFTFNSTNVDMGQTSGLTCTGPVCTTPQIQFEVPSQGVYNWTAYIDPSFGADFEGIYVSINWQENAMDHYKNSTWTGGGLRVKTVTDYSANAIAAKMRRFDYSYMANKSSWGLTKYSYGKLMSYPSYARYELTTYVNKNGPFPCALLTRTSGSVTSINSVNQGNIVGYDQVAEYTVDPNTGIDIGQTIYNYLNTPDVPISYKNYRLPGLFNFGNNLNGSLISRTKYARTGGTGNYVKVTEEDNSYHTTNKTTYLNMKYQSIPTSGAVFGCPIAPVPQFIACFYPSIVSERVLMDNTTQITYDQNDPTKFISTVKSFYYDNPVHYQVTRTSVIDSRNNTTTSFLKYPQDYATGNTNIDSLVGRNMVSEVIEKRDSLYYSGSPTGYIKAAQLNLYRPLSSHSMGLDKQFQLSLQAPVTDFQGFAFTNNATTQDTRYRQMISYDSYDNLNNPQQYTGTDLNPTTFVWDYNHVLPVAQVKNAILSDVAYSSFEADGTGNWTYTGTNTSDTTAVTGISCYNLSQTSGTITKSGLVSGSSYIVSYWTKNSSALSITGTQAGYPVKGKTIRGWTYYEHKITGQTTITVGGTGFIDELRLYPANAQMTTYTYTPLVGITCSCDVDNRVSYYFYDGLGRLRYLKDQDGNIVKTIQYHYTGQLISP